MFVFEVLLVMFNKAALSSYSFPHANIITLFQVIGLLSQYLTSILNCIARFKLFKQVYSKQLILRSMSSFSFV